MSTLSELRTSFGKGEPELQRTLASLGVPCRFSGPDTYVRVWGSFDRRLFPVRLYPDALVDSPDFGSGVFRVQGEVHDTRKHARLGGTDDRQREMYERQGLWVEDLTPAEAKDPEKVKLALERHRVVRDAYGGEL